MLPYTLHRSCLAKKISSYMFKQLCWENKCSFFSFFLSFLIRYLNKDNVNFLNTLYLYRKLMSAPVTIFIKRLQRDENLFNYKLSCENKTIIWIVGPMWANQQARNWSLHPTNTLSPSPIRLKFSAHLHYQLIIKRETVPEITFHCCALLNLRWKYDICTKKFLNAV
jgi:hypothetical protein